MTRVPFDEPGEDEFEGEGGEALGGCSVGRKTAGMYKGPVGGRRCRDCRGKGLIDCGDVGAAVEEDEGAVVVVVVNGA